MNESGLGSPPPVADPFVIALKEYQSRKRAESEEALRHQKARESRLSRFAAALVRLPAALEALRRASIEFNVYIGKAFRLDNIVFRQGDTADIYLSGDQRACTPKKVGVVLASFSPSGSVSPSDEWDSFSLLVIYHDNSSPTCAVMTRKHLKIHGVYWVMPTGEPPDAVIEAMEKLVSLALASVGEEGQMTPHAMTFFSALFEHRSPVSP